MVINADIYTHYNYLKLIHFNLPKDKKACLFFVPNPKHNLKGDYSMDLKGNVIKKLMMTQKHLLGLVSIGNVFLMMSLLILFLSLQHSLRVKLIKTMCVVKKLRIFGWILEHLSDL